VAVVLGGLGAVGIVVGAIAGAQAISDMDRSGARCRTAGPTDLCDPEGHALRQDADIEATVSTISFVAGSAAIAGGALLFFMAPSRVEPRPLQARRFPLWAGMTPELAGISLQGEW
jgi:serine/threonine-protein kinase